MKNDDLSTEKALSSDQLNQLFDIDSAPETQANEVRQQLTERAAVLGTFRPDDLLVGFEKNSETKAALDEVLREAVVVAKDGARRWLLEPRSRLAALWRLGAEAGPLLNKLKRDASDPLSEAVAALIMGKVPDLATLSNEALRAVIAAGEWLREWSKMAAGMLPRWKAELRRRELVQPLEHIVGGRFVGREKDMAKLRDFVDVVPPDSRFDGWGRWLSNLIMRRKEPLVVYGIGGIGKSTLMAQFILTHAAVSSERGFPFAYIDFDRLCLNPNNPASLLIEVLDQVGAQFLEIGPRVEAFSKQVRQEMERSRIEQHTRSRATESALQVTDHSVVERMTSQFAALMREMGMSNRPFLLVLDTFEEVQMSGESAMDSVFRWLESMFQLEHLRVVISGRTQIDGRKVARHLQLGNFDKVAALSFLQTAGLSKAISDEIFDKVGGNPLALRLCIQLAKQNGLNTVHKKDLDGWLGKKDGVYIQGYLYTRLLRHIGDQRVEKLAHPGLVLRRVTKDIILKVLAPAVGLELQSERDAQELYDALRREVSLVTEENGALVHRKDVRSVMLEMQRADDSKSFAYLNRQAVAYYSQNEPDTSVSRREATYHRLMLEDEDPFRVVEHVQREVLRSLGTSLDELPTRARAAVRALLGYGLTQVEIKMLPEEVWEAYAYRRAMALIAAGSPVEALTMLEGHKWVSDQSILLYPRALALFNTLRWLEATNSLAYWKPSQELEQPYFGFTPSEKTELRIRPLIEMGYLLWYQGEAAAARKRFVEAEKLSLFEDAPFLQLEARFGIVLADEENPFGWPENGMPNNKVQPVLEANRTNQSDVKWVEEILEQAEDRQSWKPNLLTLRRLVFLGFAPPRLMRTAVSHLGLQLRSASTIRQFYLQFGSHLSRDLLAMLERVVKADTLVATGPLELATMEKLAASEISKFLVGHHSLSVAQFIRGRYAPWKIPARIALLNCYPKRQSLEVVLHKLGDQQLLEAASQARTQQALAEVIVDHADHTDRFVQTIEVLVSHAREPNIGTDLLLRALNMYSRQMLRYYQRDGSPPDVWLLPT